MQEDMHYYGTYALARAAGLVVKDAQVIAYAAQFVDDATDSHSVVHNDDGMMESISTAHHNSSVLKNQLFNHAKQRSVWIPFHFFPGNEGDSLAKQLLCVKDSQLARTMIENHINHAISVAYGLPLMGVMAHVYADTFAHYGFSGMGSSYNAVNGDSFKFHDIKDPKMQAYLLTKFALFVKKYTPNWFTHTWHKIISHEGERFSGSLGHGAVGTYPDRPFLHWSFEYEHQSGRVDRNNPESYLEACEKLHSYFYQFAKQSGRLKHPVEFSSIKDKIETILRLEAPKERRIQAWCDAIKSGDLFIPERNEDPSYQTSEWENQKKFQFKQLPCSADASKLEIYQFYQAASYHRHYTLKHLLPDAGIVVL